MIITDGIHLVSTESEEELHEFAAGVGLKKQWYQDHPLHPHYDITTGRKLKKVLEAGVEKVSSRELIETAWWRKE